MYFCLFCHFSGSKDNIESHVAATHPTQKLVYMNSGDKICTFCRRDMTHTRMGNRLSHTRTCLLNPNREAFLKFKCDFCNKMFSRRLNLQSHLARVHEIGKDINPRIVSFISGDVGVGELYNTVSSSRIEGLGAKQVTQKFEFTETALDLAASGFICEVFTKVLGDIMVRLDFRDSSNRTQLVISASNLDFPVVSSVQAGNNFDLDSFLDRISRTDQSQRFVVSMEDQVDVQLFQFPSDTYD